MEDFIPTRVSRVRKDASKEFLSYDYGEEKRKTKDNVREKKEKPHEIPDSKENIGKSKESMDNDRKRKEELETKRIRYEVIKFGMSGFERAKVDEAKVALIVRLGAKPPKNRAINYKELKKQKEREKEMQKNERASGFEKSIVTRHRSKKKTRKRDAGGILGVYGKANKKPPSKRKNKV